VLKEEMLRNSAGSAFQSLGAAIIIIIIKSSITKGAKHFTLRKN